VWFGLSLLMLPLLVACEPELLPGPDGKPDPEYLGGLSPVRPSANAEAQAQRSRDAVAEAEQRTIVKLMEVLQQASDAKVSCPAAATWVGQLRIEARSDGWGRPFVAECVSGDLVVRSLGKDGVRGNDDTRWSLAEYQEPTRCHFERDERSPGF